MSSFFLLLTLIGVVLLIATLIHLPLVFKVWRAQDEMVEVAKNLREDHIKSGGTFMYLPISTPFGTIWNEIPIAPDNPPPPIDIPQKHIPDPFYDKAKKSLEETGEFITYCAYEDTAALIQDKLMKMGIMTVYRREEHFIMYEWKLFKKLTGKVTFKLVK